MLNQNNVEHFLVIVSVIFHDNLKNIPRRAGVVCIVSRLLDLLNLEMVWRARLQVTGVITPTNRVTVYFIPYILYPGDSISLVQSIRGQDILSAQVKRREICHFSIILTLVA